MGQPKLEQLKQTARRVVQDANRHGEIDAGLFTIGVARQRIATQMGLGLNGLDEKPWKSQVKKLVMAEMNNLADEAPGPSQSQKTSTPTPSPVKAIKSTKEGKGMKAKKVVADPDEEDDVVVGAEEDVASTMNGKGKKARKVVADPDEEEQPALEEHGNEEDATRSESEMSSLVDDGPPKKNRKSDPNREAFDKGSKRRKHKSESAELDSEDEAPKKIKVKKPAARTSKASSNTAEDPKVKELKTIVVACGVRKQWKKEFEGKDTAKQQISHLRQILGSLGMKGQPTKAKAATIKEQRELAAELGDIMEFEKARGLGTVYNGKEEPSGRPKRSAAPNRPLALSDSEEGEESEQDSDGEAEDSDSGHGTGNRAGRRVAKRVANSSDDENGVTGDSDAASDDKTAASSDDDH